MQECESYDRYRMKEVKGMYAYKKIKKMMMAVLMFLLTVQCFYNVQAEESSADKPENGVVKIVMAYKDEEGNLYYVKQGTGFLIGLNSEARSETMFVFTDYGIVEGDNEIINFLKKKYGLPQETKLSACYFAIGNMGVMVDLSLTFFSEETRYAILQPDIMMTDKPPVKLGDGEKVQLNARIRMEGYSGTQEIPDDTTIDNRDLISYSTIITDVVQEEYYDEIITYFYVGEALEEGMAGTPVFDENGYVLGMFIFNNGTLRAMSVENICTILKTLNINYLTSQDESLYDIPTNELKSELKLLVQDSKKLMESIDRNKYTDKTWNSLYEAIKEADEVCAAASSTEKQYQDSLSNLKKNMKKLKTKNYKLVVFNIIFGIIVILLFTLAIVKIRKRKKYSLSLSESKR